MRPLGPADIDDIAGLYSDAEVTRYLTGAVRTQEMSEAWLDEQLAFWRKHGRIGRFWVADRESGMFVGQCGLRDLDDSGEVELGYAFVKASWGRGVATEAARAALDHGFRNSDLDHVAGITFPANLASKKVLLNCGMRYVREDFFYGIDVSYFSITREEWSRRHGASRDTSGSAGG